MPSLGGGALARAHAVVAGEGDQEQAREVGADRGPQTLDHRCSGLIAWGDGAMCQQQGSAPGGRSVCGSTHHPWYRALSTAR